MVKILYCQDDPDHATTRAEYWEKMGYDVTVCTSAGASMLKVMEGGDWEVVFVHKDLGLGKEKYGAVDVLSRLLEYVRKGVESGEYPDGRRSVVEELKADLYFPTELRSGDQWLINQINRGAAWKKEFSLRGRDVEMPPPSSIRQEKCF